MMSHTTLKLPIIAVAHARVIMYRYDRMKSTIVALVLAVRAGGAAGAEGGDPQSPSVLRCDTWDSTINFVLFSPSFSSFYRTQNGTSTLQVTKTFSNNIFKLEI